MYGIYMCIVQDRRNMEICNRIRISGGIFIQDCLINWPGRTTIEFLMN